MSADEAVRQRAHGVCQNIPADSLHNVFHELWTVGFYTASFLLGVNPHVGNGLTAEFVLPDSRLDISQLPAGGQADEQHAATHFKCHIANGLRFFRAYSFFDRLVQSPSVCDNAGIRLTPHVHQQLKLILHQPHAQGIHGFQRADRAAVARGELGDFTFLAQVTVDTMLFYGHLEHLTGGGTVNIFSIVEDLGTPLFSCKMGQHSRLNGAEV